MDCQAGWTSRGVSVRRLKILEASRSTRWMENGQAVRHLSDARSRGLACCRAEAYQASRHFLATSFSRISAVAWLAHLQPTRAFRPHAPVGFLDSIFLRRLPHCDAPSLAGNPHEPADWIEPTARWRLPFLCCASLVYEKWSFRLHSKIGC